MILDIKEGDYTLDQFSHEAAMLSTFVSFTQVFNAMVMYHAFNQTAQHPFFGGSCIQCMDSMIDDYEGDLEKDFFEGNTLNESAYKFTEYVINEFKKDI